MPRGYRLLIIASGGIAVLSALGVGAYFGSLYGPDRKQYQTVAGSKPGQNDYQGPSQSLPDIAGLPGPVERAIANPRANTGHDHEKRDLAAQEASALWAFWMVLASFLSILITTVGTILLYQQIMLTREAVQDTGDATKAMHEANRISNEALSAARKLEEGKMLLIYSNARIEKHLWRCTLQAANLGRSPILIQHCNSQIAGSEPRQETKIPWISLIADIRPIIIDSQAVELIEFQWTIEDISECPFLVTRIVYSTNFRENVARYHVIRPIIDGTYGGLCNYIFIGEWEELET